MSARSGQPDVAHGPTERRGESPGRGRCARFWWDQTATLTAYDYDKAGNRTQAGVRSFTYDAQNRLKTAGAATHSWSDRGTLASVTTSGTTTTSTFDAYGQNLMNGTVTMTYDALGRIATRNGAACSYSGLDLDPVNDGTWITNRSLDGTVLSTKQTTGANARWEWLASENYVAVWWPRPEGRDELSPSVRTLDGWLSRADSE